MNRVAARSIVTVLALLLGGGCRSNQVSTPVDSGSADPSQADGGMGSASDAGSTDVCTSIPGCQHPCADGATNPIDGNGCVNSCECTPAPNAGDAGASAADAGKATTSWWYTCGDPVCRGHTGTTGVLACTTEKPGDACKIDGARCDPGDACNRLLVCAANDPRLRAGGCPISRAAFKQDIRYLTPEQLAPYGDRVLHMRLATWRYRHDPARERLGFIIDDDETSPAVDGARDMVDLYGYTSLLVASVQRQAQEIEALKTEVTALKRSQKERARAVAARTR
jgi:hypothetical protein